jgi:hypothetical protein
VIQVRLKISTRTIADSERGRTPQRARAVGAGLAVDALVVAASAVATIALHRDALVRAKGFAGRAGDGNKNVAL